MTELGGNEIIFVESRGVKTEKRDEDANHVMEVIEQIPTAGNIVIKTEQNENSPFVHEDPAPDTVHLNQTPIKTQGARNMVRLVKVVKSGEGGQKMMVIPENQLKTINGTGMRNIKVATQSAAPIKTMLSTNDKEMIQN